MRILKLKYFTKVLINYFKIKIYDDIPTFKFDHESTNSNNIKPNNTELKML